MRKLRVVLVVLMVLTLAISPTSFACTGIILRTLDGTTLIGRTMEFGFDIKSDILVVPAGTKYTTLGLNSERSGFTFEAKYGFVGANALDKPIIVDGVNEKGLYFRRILFSRTRKIFQTYNRKSKQSYSERRSRKLAAKPVCNGSRDQSRATE